MREGKGGGSERVELEMGDIVERARCVAEVREADPEERV